MPEMITVLIPCRNEADNIADCIDSVRGIADEILVADSGSTDGTIEIVRGIAGCRLIQGEWTGYSKFKNWATSFASNAWILFLDADERMTPALAGEIRQAVAAPSDNVDAYAVRFHTYFMGHRVRFCNWNNSAVRLVRRGRCRFVKTRAHERLDVDPLRTRILKGHLRHYSFWTYDEYFEKYTRYAKLCAKDLRDQGNRATTYSLLVRPFLRFFYLYILKGGFLDGVVGIQVSMLTAFFYSFSKQARLWEMESAELRPRANKQPTTLPFPDLDVAQVSPVGEIHSRSA